MGLYLHTPTCLNDVNRDCCTCLPNARQVSRCVQLCAVGTVGWFVGCKTIGPIIEWHSVFITYRPVRVDRSLLEVATHLNKIVTVLEHTFVRVAVLEHTFVRVAVLEHTFVGLTVLGHTFVRVAVLEHTFVRVAVLEHTFVGLAVLGHTFVRVAVLEHTFV
jgi:hypothetical protein